MLEALLRAGVAQRTTRGIGACYPTGVAQRRPLLSLPGQQRLGGLDGLDAVTGATCLLWPRRPRRLARLGLSSGRRGSLARAPAGPTR